jgi:hypothetical protein
VEPVFQLERHDGDYLVRVTIAEVEDRLRVVGVEFWGIDPPTEERWTTWREHLETTAAITPTVLRLPITRLADEAIEELRRRWAGLIARSLTTEAAGKALEALERPGRPQGRPGHGPEHWRAVRAVVQAARTGGERPATAVAKAFVISERTAQEWIRRASQNAV